MSAGSVSKYRTIGITAEAYTALESLLADIKTATGEEATASTVIMLGVHLIKNGDNLSALESIASLISVEAKRPVSVNQVINAASGISGTEPIFGMEGKQSWP